MHIPSFQDTTLPLQFTVQARAWVTLQTEAINLSNQAELEPSDDPLEEDINVGLAYMDAGDFFEQHKDDIIAPEGVDSWWPTFPYNIYVRRKPEYYDEDKLPKSEPFDLEAYLEALPVAEVQAEEERLTDLLRK